MKHILKTVHGSLSIIVFVVVTLTAFLIGYVRGYNFGQLDATNAFQKYLDNKVSSTTQPAATVLPVRKLPSATKSTWGGPQLWENVNKRRIEFGVNPLKVKEELCTIAAIRLNQLLDLDKLDGHEGFSKLPTERPDLKWIFEKYNISEFLVSGATSPQNAVDLWENTLGHKLLLSGGEYSLGCVYAQNGFGVAIAAY